MYDATSVTPTGDEERARRLFEDASRHLWPGAVLDSVEPMRGDASSRRYLRCRMSATRSRRGPASCIAMLMNGETLALSSEELSVLGPEGPDELPFLNVLRFLSKVTDSAPRLYHCNADHSGLLLEDVGDVSLWQAASERPADAERLFEKALDLLADMQTRAKDDGSGCFAFRQRFDATLYNWEFDHFIEYGIRDANAAGVDACKAELARVAAELSAADAVFCHRDYHAWNIHVLDDGLRLLDFQDALLGNPLYDVASLLTDRVTPQLIDSEMEVRLLYRFAISLPPGHPLAGHDPLTAYNRCALQRALKVIGRFNYLADVKGKTSYRRFLPAVGATASRLCTRLEGLDATAEVLATAAKLGAGGEGEAL